MVFVSHTYTHTHTHTIHECDSLEEPQGYSQQSNEEHQQKPSERERESAHRAEMCSRYLRVAVSWVEGEATLMYG